MMATTNICIYWFSTKYTALRSKSKDWLARNQDHVSEWGDMSIRRLLFHWAGTIKIVGVKQQSLWTPTGYNLQTEINWLLKMCMISFWGISAQIISLFKNPTHLLNLLDLPLSHFQKTTCIYILFQKTTCIYILF